MEQNKSQLETHDKALKSHDEMMKALGEALSAAPKAELDRLDSLIHQALADEYDAGWAVGHAAPRD
jgi:hypothetical protein